MSTFGINIYNLRKSRGLTQQQLAEIIGSNQASVTAWERGARMPPLNTIQEIANKLHVPMSNLISIGTLGNSMDENRELFDMIQSNEKIHELVNRIRFLSEDDIDLVLGVVTAMTKDVYTTT